MIRGVIRLGDSTSHGGQEKLRKPSSRIHVEDRTVGRIDEGRRAKILLENEFGFSDEDFYDPGSHGAEYDE